MKRNKKLKIKHVYFEPKTSKDESEQQHRINDAFEVLFTETIKYLNEKKRLK